MCDAAKGFQESLLPNGSWSDIQYNSSERTDWQAVVHLERLAIMSRAYVSEMCGPSKSDSALVTAALRALSFWLDEDPKAPQWWWLQFGAPQWVAVSSVLLKENLTATQLNQTLVVLDRAKGRFTGQNLLWSLQILLTKAVLARDADAVAKQFTLMWGAVEVQHYGGDGIQPDWSEYQHGHVLQSGAYGGDFALNIITYLSMVAGTDYMPGASTLGIITSYALDGQRPMVYSAPLPPASQGDRTASPPLTVYDLLVKGREITRAPNGTMNYPASVIQQSAALIAAAQPPLPRQAEWKAFSDQLSGKPGASNAEGTRHYPYGDYTSHFSPSGGESDGPSPGWMQGVKVWSNRTESSECVNDEGQLSWHMSSGIVTTYRTGAEYLGVFPVWNWTALPGLTSVQGVQESHCGVKKLGPNAAAGGAALGPAGGVTAYDFISGNFVSDSKTYSQLTARKMYAHLPGLGTVVLVADLRQQKDAEGRMPWVSTSLEQSLLHGDVVVGTADGHTQTLPEGQHSVPGASWVWHAGIGYASLASPTGGGAGGLRGTASLPAFPSALAVSNRPVNGSWARISTTQSPDLVTKSVFQAGLPHGSGVSGLSFAYAVLPVADSASEMQSLAGDLGDRVVVASNDAGLQAATFNGSTFAAVWQDPSEGRAAAQGAPVPAVAGISGAPFAIIMAPSDAISSESGAPSVQFGVSDLLTSQGGRTVVFKVGMELAGSGSGAFSCEAGSAPGTTKVTVKLAEVNIGEVQLQLDRAASLLKS